MNYWMTLMLATLLAGCSAFPAQQAVNMHRYLLDAKPAVDSAPHKNNQAIEISLPTAWPGFDSPQMVYLQKPLELEYFASHRWVDTPAHMIKPLLAQALAQRFGTVITTPGTLGARFRLDTELVRLQQNFTNKPSRIQLTLKARLIDVKDKRVIAEKLFDESENAESDDAYGGAVAANRALQRVLDQLAEFCIYASTGQ